MFLPKSDLSATLRTEVVRIVQEFQSGGEAGPLAHFPQLVDQLLGHTDEASRSVALQALIVADLERRWRAGEGALLEQYIELFPEIGGAEKTSAALVQQEYRIRHECGDPVPLESYERRFPQQFGEMTPLSDGDFQRTDAHPAVPELSLGERHEVALPLSFRLIDRLGRGTAGEVWRARAIHEGVESVEVAVKLISRPPGHRITKKELSALDLMKRLRHPFLMPIHAYGFSGGCLVVVSELADGSLKTRNDECEGKIPIAELLRYIEESASALDYLKREGVAHRDVKPANILILQSHAKLGDFGLARLLIDESPDMEATRVGTPLYMSPEIWLRKLSPESDQYSLAATFAELQLGRPLFNVRSLDEAAIKHISEKPDLAPLPKAQQRVLRKALSKQPEHRYPSCTAFAEDLRWATLVQPKRNRMLAVLAALLLLVLVPLGGWIAARPYILVRTPSGFRGTRDANIQFDGRNYYYTEVILLRPKFDDCPFVLIASKEEGDLRTFYAMRNKVSERQYAAYVEESLVSEREDCPKFEVTAYDARNFASWLGDHDGDDGARIRGRLPSLAQWNRAAGFEPDKHGKRYPAKPFGKDGKWSESSGGDFAVNQGKEGPRRVGAAKDDESIFGCRDMFGNGREWTRTSDQGDDLSDAPLVFLAIVGASWDAERPYAFERFQRTANTGDGDIMQAVSEKPDIGFRVVLEFDRPK